jgi:hypothetical protein
MVFYQDFPDWEKMFHALHHVLAVWKMICNGIDSSFIGLTSW